MPAALFGIDQGADGAGQIARGRRADLCLFALDRSWRIEAGGLPGKAQNTPFDGRAVEGVVIGTWKSGIRVFG
jgi:dihydroorotase